MGGFAGCNNYFGSYTVSGQQMTVGLNVGSTMMACPAAQTTMESGD